MAIETEAGGERNSIALIRRKLFSEVDRSFNHKWWTAFNLQEHLSNVLSKDAKVEKHQSV